MEPEKKGASGPRRKSTMYERMEEARIRRAEVLALKEPANDVPVKRGTAAKPTAAAPVKEPVEDRFPSIVMPEPKLEPIVLEPMVEAPAKKPNWALRAIALIVLLIGAAYLMPSEPQPLVVETIDTQTTPIIESPAFLAPTFEKTPRPPVSHLAAINPVSPKSPLIGAPVAPPTLLVAMPALKTPAPDKLPFWPATDNAIERTAMTQPLLPDVETLFAPSVPTQLSVSLNVSSAASADEVRDVGAALAQSGMIISEPRVVTFTIKSTQVRYFHTSDAKAATELGAAIDGTVRDFTSFTPAPPRGYVEVWIKSRNTSAPSPRAEPEPGALDGLGRDLRQMRSNIANALRSITQ